MHPVLGVRFFMINFIKNCEHFSINKCRVHINMVVRSAVLTCLLIESYDSVNEIRTDRGN